MIVVWRVGTHCNLGCGFCAYARDLDFPRRAITPRRVRRFAATLADFRRARGERVLVSWLGGEPLIWRPLEKLSGELAAVGLDVSATTNGTALSSPRVRAHIARHYAELTVSVDGLGDRHDALRRNPGGFAKLERDVRALLLDARERQRPLFVRVNSILMRDNVAEFPALCERVAQWGVREITFNQLGGNDRPEFHVDHRLEPVQLARLAQGLPELRRRLAGMGVRLAGAPAYLSRLAASARDETVEVPDCRPGERFLFVDENGLVAPCSFTTADYGVAIESLSTSADIEALPAAFRVARAARASPWCRNCPSTQWFGKFAA